MVKNTEIIFKTVNPTKGKEERVFDENSNEELEKYLNKAEVVFKTWKNVSFSERAKYIKKTAQLFRDRQDELAHLAEIEMGKPLREGIGEAQIAACILDYYADNAETFLKDEPVKSFSGKAFISYEPNGLLLSIQPWNFPFYQIIRAAAPNIMA